MPRLCGAWAICALLLACTASCAQGSAEAPEMSPSNTTVPSFIMFSLDGALMEAAWDAGYDRFIKLVDARNPNGCRIPMTWFASFQGRGQGKCEVAQRALQTGHELATHSVMHSLNILNYTYEEMKADIGGVKDWLISNCSIPKEHVVGYRAPYFKINDFTGKALYELDFLYDSSLPDAEPTQRAGRWDQGMELVCNRDYRQCSTWKQYPLWEVPVWRLPGDDKRTDPAPSVYGGRNLTVYERLEEAFLQKRGYGVPVVIATHENYVTAAPDAVDEMVEFIDWALGQPNTWAVTYHQYIQWLENPDRSMEDILADWPCDDS